MVVFDGHLRTVGTPGVDEYRERHSPKEALKAGMAPTAVGRRRHSDAS